MEKAPTKAKMATLDRNADEPMSPTPRRKVETPQAADEIRSSGRRPTFSISKAGASVYQSIEVATVIDGKRTIAQLTNAMAREMSCALVGKTAPRIDVEKYSTGKHKTGKGSFPKPTSVDAANLLGDLRRDDGPQTTPDGRIRSAPDFPDLHSLMSVSWQRSAVCVRL
jgi:hypothetical protein